MAEPAPNAAIGALEKTLGAESTRELVRLFLTEFQDSIRAMRTAAPEEQLRLAHGMKSSARHMGADGLSMRMAALEARLLAKGAAIDQDDLGNAARDFGAVEPALRKYAG
ncbi:MAG TPA: Hpt domain-containing protein [Opitutaceae bacterium]|jgi:HPt (histidine-containing phosphotransfer) domain-containing protein